MKKAEIKRKQQHQNAGKPESVSRRRILKKAAYVAPSLIILGVVTPIEAAGQSGFTYPPPPPTGQTGPSIK